MTTWQARTYLQAEKKVRDVAWRAQVRLCARYRKIPPGRNPPDDLNVIVEIPQGDQPVKYELDKESGAIFVDRFLHTAMFYPGNYGFVPQTLAEDGDPVDVLIVGPASVVPGAVVRS